MFARGFVGWDFLGPLVAEPYTLRSPSCPVLLFFLRSFGHTTPPSQNHEIFLGEEEISDVSLATFYVFDKENVGPPPLSQKLRLAAGCGAGCSCGCACGGFQPQPPQSPHATQPTQHLKKKVRHHR
jgi:hypothetical protein